MRFFVFYITLTLLTISATAQEENTDVYQAKRYLDINIKKQDKFNARVKKQQEKVLDRLKRKEGRFAKKLQRNDSAAYATYQKNPLTFDSISRSGKPDSASIVKKSKNRVNRSFDTLKGIKSYIEDKAHVTGDGPSATDGYDSKLISVKGSSQHNQDVGSMITQRTNFLKSIKTRDRKTPGLKSIQKQTFYSNEKIKTFKQISDEPSVAEEKALEYLQGKEGFDEYLSYTEGKSMKNLGSLSTDELEKMGYQTKRKVQANLQKKLGSDLMGLQNKMGGQVKDYQDKLQDIKEVKNTAKQAKASVKGLQHTEKPAFKVNPMRGLPFYKRIAQQYNWQTTRASNDGKPAVFSFSYLAGFKHTAKLSYGLGVATSIGLGSNWNNVRISFEGVGLRSYAAWQWQYGIGAYAGYERMYKQAVFVTKEETTAMLNETHHNKKAYNEAVLIGLTKAYRINDKMNGSIQVLYDIWWKEKGLRSPIQLRFATMKN